MVAPSQVTCPGSPHEQLPSAAEQLLPEQSTVPPFQQLAEQKDFTPKAGFLAEGFLAASSGAGVPASEAMKAWSDRLGAGTAGAGLADAIAGDRNRQRAATAKESSKSIFFTAVSFLQ